MNINQEAYNKFEQLPQMPYNIITSLIQNNENVWKLINYNSPDALQLPNLTQEQKAKLIWNGQEDSEDYRVFMQPVTDDAFTTMCSQIRVFPIVIIPTNRTLGIISFGIEILSHVKINQLNNYQTRILTLLQEVISTLNGTYINGIGQLFFDKSASYDNSAKLNLFNNRNYCGYTLIMSNRAV
ncbi:MAG TPA: hypothetical protein VIK86_08080 [Candidatus Paceibacterota bacterium]